MPVYKIKAPLYKVPVYVTFDPESLHKKFNIADDYEFCQGRSGEVGVLDNGEHRLVYVCFNSEFYSADVLTHECIHAAWRVLDIVGVAVDSGNHEALAYLAGYLSSEIQKRWIKEFGE